MARAAPCRRGLGDVVRVRRDAEARDLGVDRALPARAPRRALRAPASRRLRRGSCPAGPSQNGRQVSGETTRIASQALRNPQLKTASCPPAARRPPPRCAPSRTPGRWRASRRRRPSKSCKAGPVIPISMVMWLAPALPITRGIISGFTRGRLLLVEIDEAFVHRILPADRAAGHHGRAFRLEHDAGIAHRLPRRHERELRRPVEQGEFLVAEVLARLVVHGLRSIDEAERSGKVAQRANAGNARRTARARTTVHHCPRAETRQCR